VGRLLQFASICTADLRKQNSDTLGQHGIGICNWDKLVRREVRRALPQGRDMGQEYCVHDGGVRRQSI